MPAPIQLRPGDQDLIRAIAASGMPTVYGLPDDSLRAAGLSVENQGPASWQDRLALIAQWMGNALPARGGFSYRELYDRPGKRDAEIIKRIGELARNVKPTTVLGEPGREFVERWMRQPGREGGYFPIPEKTREAIKAAKEAGHSPSARLPHKFTFNVFDKVYDTPVSKYVTSDWLMSEPSGNSFVPSLSNLEKRMPKEVWEPQLVEQLKRGIDPEYFQMLMQHIGPDLPEHMIPKALKDTGKVYVPQGHQYGFNPSGDLPKPPGP